jgi:hypothetical protein
MKVVLLVDIMTPPRLRDYNDRLHLIFEEI